jgi:hypothetical protein
MAIEIIGEGAGYYRYRYLMGATQRAMMIATVRQACIKEDVRGSLGRGSTSGRSLV